MTVALGAKVIATAGSAAKLEIAKKHGFADYAFDYTKTGWEAEIKKLTKGKGVDGSSLAVSPSRFYTYSRTAWCTVVYDPVGYARQNTCICYADVSFLQHGQQKLEGHCL